MEARIMRPVKHLVRAVCLVASIVASACGPELTSSDPPAGAHAAEDGVRWLRTKPGAGRLGAHAEWWSVRWTDIPCRDVCEHVYNGHRGTELYDPFRSNLVAMREGEVRRLWIPRRGGGGFWTAEVELSAVYATASDGGPLVPPQSPPKFPVQPYERGKKTTSTQ